MASVTIYLPVIMPVNDLKSDMVREHYLSKTHDLDFIFGWKGHQDEMALAEASVNYTPGSVITMLRYRVTRPMVYFGTPDSAHYDSTVLSWEDQLEYNRRGVYTFAQLDGSEDFVRRHPDIPRGRDFISAVCKELEVELVYSGDKRGLVKGVPNNVTLYSGYHHVSVRNSLDITIDGKPNSNYAK